MSDKVVDLKKAKELRKDKPQEQTEQQSEIDEMAEILARHNRRMEKQKQERLKKNRSVLRSYRIKDSDK